MDDVARPPFTVTRSAIETITALGGCLLVDLARGGCCGTAYVFSTCGSPEELPAAASRFGCPGAWMGVMPPALEVLAGATLDYRATSRPPRFRVLRNPNTPEVCPCRRSFGAPWPGPGHVACRSYEPMPWDTEFRPPAAWTRQTRRGRGDGAVGS